MLSVDLKKIIMQIKTPSPKKLSRPVLEFATIKDDARAMTKLLLNYVSPAGKKSDQHYAIHHSQYKSNPYNFFVVNPLLFGDPLSLKDPENQVMVVVNPKILDKVSASRKTVREACMSFPFRPGIKVNRYDIIYVSYDVPDEDGKKLIHKEEEKWLKP